MDEELAKNKVLYERFNAAKSAFLTDLQISSQSAATYEKYEMVLREFATWLFSNDAEQSRNENGGEIEPTTILAWKQATAKRGVSVNTVAHYLTILRGFFRWATENGYYKSQPVLASAFPRTKEIQHDILTLDEIKLLLRGDLPPRIRKSVARRNRAIVIFLIASGLRVSELINLKISDLNFEKQRVYVSHGKGSKARYAPFPTYAQVYVREYLQNRAGKSEYVFTIPDESRPAFTKPDVAKPQRIEQEAAEQPLTRDAVTALVKRYVFAVTGHNGIGAHDLRHAAASLWDHYGASMRAVQKALGHSNVQTTERVYVDILNKPKAAQEISALFPDPFSGETEKAEISASAATPQSLSIFSEQYEHESLPFPEPPDTNKTQATAIRANKFFSLRRISLKRIQGGSR